MGQLLIKDPAELYYMERTVFTKDENTNNTWTFELGSYGESPPTFVIVGFQARNKIDSQTHDKEISDRLTISNAVCNRDQENIPMMESSVFMIESITNYQLYSETDVFFIHLNPFIYFTKFMTNHNFFVYDLSKQKHHIAS